VYVYSGHYFCFNSLIATLFEGGRLLAYYEESSRKFLFPDKSLTKKDGLDREILLSRTAKFQVKISLFKLN
jgi:hypothetical protein